MTVGKIQRKKITRDLWNDFNRSFLLITGLFIGIFSLCLIMGSFVVIKRESRQSFADTSPASFSLWLGRSDAAMLDELKKLENIGDVEPRPMVRSRFADENGEWREAYLYVVDDFEKIRINKLTYVEGDVRPPVNGIIMDELSLGILGLDPDGEIAVKTPLNEAQKLKIAGTVNASGLKPAWIEEIAYGFITGETFENLGGSAEFEQILFTVRENVGDKAYISKVCGETRDYLTDLGYPVNRVEVNTPDVHPNGKQIDALMFLFEIFSVLALVLSCVLAVNLISTFLARQRQQVGIMKALGATSAQISLLYYYMVLCISLIAAAPAITAGYFASGGVVAFCAGMLNLTVSSRGIPVYIILLEAVAGIGIPLVSTAFLIRRQCRRKIRENLYVSDDDRESQKRQMRLPAFFSTLTSMAVRNSFRRKKRLILTIVTLSVGGAVFILSFNLRNSLNATTDNAMERLHYDAIMIFSASYDAEEIEKHLESSAEIEDVEVFAGGMAFMQDDRAGGQSNSFLLLGVTPDCRSFDYPLIRGKRLSSCGEYEAVVNQVFLTEHSELDIGDQVTIVTNAKAQEWTIAGVVKEIGGDGSVYVNLDSYISAYVGEGQPYGREAAVFAAGDKVKEAEFIAKAESIAMSEGFDILNVRKKSDVESAFVNHLKLISGFLTILSVLIISVGGVGIVSLVSISVIERAWEIGVMMSVGATNRDIIGLFIKEGTILGVLIVCISAVLALPLSYHVSGSFGSVFLQAALDFRYSLAAVVLWFILAFMIIVLSNYFIVNGFLKKKICNVLSYE